MQPTTPPAPEVIPDLDRMTHEDLLTIVFGENCQEAHQVEFRRRIAEKAEKDLLLFRARERIQTLANTDPRNLPPGLAYRVYNLFAEALKVCIDYSKSNHRQCFSGLHAEIKTS